MAKEKTNTPKSESLFDIAFVGSGIATSFTILKFLEKLTKSISKTPLSIALIDQYPEFHTGIPYGTRSGNSALLITSLEDFIPQPERQGFLDWLSTNKHWILEKFRVDGGVLSQSWLDKHELAISKDEWSKIFVPRRFFGWYISEKVNESIARAEDKGLIKIHYFNTCIEDIYRQNDAYFIRGDIGDIKTHKVILSIGSPPPKTILPEQKGEFASEDIMLISNPYQPGISENLEKINQFIEKRKGEKVNILVIGANASALEILYKLNDNHQNETDHINFIFLSSLGLTPDSRIDHQALRDFRPSNLLALKNREGNTAKNIAEAAYADLAVAEARNIRAATSIGPISIAFGDLLGDLEPQELEKFACFYGNEIGRRQRIAGTHYSDVVTALEKKGRFRHIAGRYSEIIVGADDKFFLKYKAQKTNDEQIDKTPLDVVVNCIGGEMLDNKNITPLFASIMASGLCSPNPSLRGFSVNQELESSPNFHIIGPLLAGNVISKRALWHLEHCGRIIWSSNMMSEILFDYFQETHENVESRSIAPK